MDISGNIPCLRPTNHPKPLPPKIPRYPIDTICNIYPLLYRHALSRVPERDCLKNSASEILSPFFSPFQLFCQFFLPFKTTCLWSLVVVLEWDSIHQEWGKWSGAKELVLVRRNMSKKGVGSKCALCLHRDL